MVNKSTRIIFFTGVLVFLIGVFMNGMPLQAKSSAGPSSQAGSDVALVGIIDPDGHKRVWALPAEAAAGILRRLAAKYPRNTTDGVSFFHVASWRDTSYLLVEAQAHQARVIADLYKEMNRLKTSSPDARLTHRVTKLEKRLIEITDPGLR